VIHRARSPAKATGDFSVTDKTAFADAALLEELTSIAMRASAAILAIREGAFSIREKSDASPVTEADHAAEEIILAGLSPLLPGIPVVSEEAHARAAAPQPGATFALVDPLDGTREFVAGRDEFTVNIALVVDGVPRAGVIAAPARQMLWRGAVGKHAEKLKFESGHATGVEKISTRRLDRPQCVLMSRSHPDAATEALVNRWPGIETLKMGSSLKFGLIADGTADIYPRLGPVCEWDIAAGHAIVVAAGGCVVAPDGRELSYGGATKNFVVPGFVAWANTALRDQGASER
jgi:3'(2'), 5'-bisphosphate nucleotidase